MQSLDFTIDQYSPLPYYFQLECYLKQEIDTRVNYKDLSYIEKQLYNQNITLSHAFIIIKIKEYCNYKKIHGRIYLEKKEADDFVKNIVEYKTKHKYRFKKKIKE